jgi:tetratricopeptide (TPR) repeat protein
MEITYVTVSTASARALRVLSIGGFFAVGMAAVLPRAASASEPTKSEIRRFVPFGAYLAGRHAVAERDAVAAAAFYRAALRSDPKNKDILDRAFLAFLAGGQVDEAVRLADKISQTDRKDGIARLVLGVSELKKKHYKNARQQLGQSVRGPITDLTATLLSAWASQGSSDPKGAEARISRLAGPDWYNQFKELNAGLILDLAGRRREAGSHLEKAHELAPTDLRAVEAYSGWLTRNQNDADAIKILDAYKQLAPHHPLILDDLAMIKKGQKIPLLVGSPQEGAAEVLYGLGAYLSRRGGEDLGLLYLRLSLYLAPTHPMALITLGDMYAAAKKPDLAISLYEKVPERSPLRANADVQRALNLDAADKTDEAKELLQKQIAKDPHDIDAIMAYGSILRTRKDYAACADAYTKAVDEIGTPSRAEWTLFYFRGICYERSKNWNKAEADLKKALELYPDQPQVLNYLGYSWIDQGKNLDDGMAMINKAVNQKPNDGYFVDSLGWAYYRTGKMDQAVEQMERAVELKPEDPTINDHLGDVYWKVGREREAKFQWMQARDLKPEPDELEQLNKKIANGLPGEPSDAAQAEKRKKADNGG